MSTPLDNISRDPEYCRYCYTRKGAATVCGLHGGLVENCDTPINCTPKKALGAGQTVLTCPECGASFPEPTVKITNIETKLHGTQAVTKAVEYVCPECGETVKSPRQWRPS